MNHDVRWNDLVETLLERSVSPSHPSTIWLILLLAGAAWADPRNVETGHVIPSIHYADQPYIAITPKGEWVCVLTTGPGKEGAGGQHVVSATSADFGNTWSPLVPIEPAAGPAASWANPLVTPFGRVYAFYTYNGDKVHLGRDDTHGWYALKYSDDGGRTWSNRHRLPVRDTACDSIQRGGKTVHHFWSICKPIVQGSTVYFAFTKLGKYFLEQGEGWVFRSDNILTERDVGKLHWEMLPTGEHGIRNPKFGSVQEEHNLAALSRPGHLACVYRTTKGFPAISYSRDGARTWTLPEPMRVRPDGPVIRHPRACPKIWRCGNGKFLFWCHENGGTDFNHRNPVWVRGGIERNGVLHWSEPEVLLYHDDAKKRMSYPDLVEQDGRTWVTETEKEVARVHEVDPTLLEGLWGQFEGGTVTKRGLALSLDGKGEAPLPALSAEGFSVELWITLRSLEPSQVILDSRVKGKGIAVVTTKAGTLALAFGDGTGAATWDVDKGRLKPGVRHHVVFIVDRGPGIVSCVVDGRFCDGGTAGRQFGWGRFDRRIGPVGGGTLRLHADARLRIYARPLRTSEAVGNWRAGREAP